jgi:hypothetical protein
MNNWVRCKYCGAILRRDPVGQYCPTWNCQWEFGLPEDEAEEIQESEVIDE